MLVKVLRMRCGVAAKDCVLADEWQPWSECDTRCGYGVQVRVRGVISEPVNGGQQCGETIQRRLCEGTRCKLTRSHHGTVTVSQLKGIMSVSYTHLTLPTNREV